MLRSVLTDVCEIHYAMKNAPVQSKNWPGARWSMDRGARGHSEIAAPFEIAQVVLIATVFPAPRDAVIEESDGVDERPIRLRVESRELSGGADENCSQLVAENGQTPGVFLAFQQQAMKGALVGAEGLRTSRITDELATLAVNEPGGVSTQLADAGVFEGLGVREAMHVGLQVN